VTEPGAEAELLDIALEKLAALRLVVIDAEAGVVRARPAIARFALDEPTIRDKGKGTADAASARF
jgi:hypothetical protein